MYLSDLAMVLFSQEKDDAVVGVPPDPNLASPNPNTVLDESVVSLPKNCGPIAEVKIALQDKASLDDETIGSADVLVVDKV